MSFSKGCYVAQQLTSRMKHRATTRKRILTVDAQGPLPQPGTGLHKGATEIGEMVATYGARGFALVRLDRLDDASGDVTAGQIPVALARPAWLQSLHGA